MHLIITKIALFFVFLFANTAMAQSAHETSADSQNSNTLINFYHNFRTESDPIYNGLEYDRYPFYINSGIPYFASDTMTLGSVVYDGIFYKDLPLMYDMILDELITKDFTGKNMMKMVKQKVDSFYLYGEKFVFIASGDKIMPEGYYQLVQQGENQLLKKEIKVIKDRVKFGEDLQKNIESKITYYVKRDGKYFISNSPVN